MNTRKLFARAALLVALPAVVAAQTTGPAPQANEPLKLSPFEVAESKDHGYASSQSLIGSRTNTPVRDVPQTISILTAELLEDIATDNLNDALRYMAGVEEEGQLGRQESRFRIRGFQNAIPSKNGIKSAAPGTNAGMMDTHNVERIEVLKGPASLLYGSTSPGGLINTVPKAPREAAQTIFRFSTNNYNLVKPEIDYNHPLNDSKSVLFRFIGLYSTEDDFRNDVFFDRVSIYPSLTWRITDRTAVTFSAEYVEREMCPPGNLVENRTQTAFLPDVPYTFNSSGPLNVRIDDSLDLTYDVRHQFNRDWSLRHAARWSKNNHYRSFTVAGIINPDLLTLNGQSNDVHLDGESWVVQNDVSGVFRLGTTKHKVIFGGDYGETQEHDMRFRANTSPANYRILDTPGRGPVNPIWPAPPTYPVNPRIRRGVDDYAYGMYVNDSIYMFDERFIIVLGARYDKLEQGGINYLATAPAWTHEKFDATTVRYGVVYKANDILSIYSGYSESFVPIGGANPDGERFDPESGEGIETGLMATFNDGRLIARVAYADTDQKNLLLPDPDPVRAGQGYMVQTGLENTKAFEVEVTASPIDRWSMIASYTHLNTEIQNHVPDSARFWNKYDFTTGRFRGLSLGLGWIHVSDRRKGAPESPFFPLAGYNRFDGLIAYRGKIGERTYKVQLNVNNLFEKEYVSNGRAAGNPETEYRLTLQYAF